MALPRSALARSELRSNGSDFSAPAAGTDPVVAAGSASGASRAVRRARRADFMRQRTRMLGWDEGDTMREYHRRGRNVASLKPVFRALHRPAPGALERRDGVAAGPAGPHRGLVAAGHR